MTVVYALPDYLGGYNCQLFLRHGNGRVTVVVIDDVAPGLQIELPMRDLTEGDGIGRPYPELRQLAARAINAAAEATR